MTGQQLQRHRLTEVIAIAIARADERNGAPPYEHRITMGKTVKEQLFDEAEAVVDLLEQLGMWHDQG